jgi:hypothetical protein
MPKKVLALLLIIITIFAVIDLTLAARTQFASGIGTRSLAGVGAKVAVSEADRANAVAKRVPTRPGVVRATWQASDRQ